MRSALREKVITKKFICEHCFYLLCSFIPQIAALISLYQSILKQFLKKKNKVQIAVSGDSESCEGQSCRENNHSTKKYQCCPLLKEQWSKKTPNCSSSCQPGNRHCRKRSGAEGKGKVEREWHAQCTVIVTGSRQTRITVLVPHHSP